MIKKLKIRFDKDEKNDESKIMKKIELQSTSFLTDIKIIEEYLDSIFHQYEEDNFGPDAYLFWEISQIQKSVNRLKKIIKTKMNNNEEE